jgi:hypothetical protein
MKLLINTTKALCSIIQSDYLCIESRQHNTYFFLFKQIQSMPDILRLAFNFFLFLFAILPIFRYGSVFHKLSFDKKKYILNQWRTSRLKFKNDFINFFDSLIIFDLANKKFSIEN